MKKLIIISIIVMSTLATSCGRYFKNASLSSESIYSLIEQGDFEAAAQMIKLKLSIESLSPQEKYDWLYEIERMDRISKDFTLDDTTVFAKIKEYYPDLTQEEFEKWSNSNAIENMSINGKIKYFGSSARNLFRIDKEAGEKYQAIKGRQSDSLDRFLAKYIPTVIKEAKQTSRQLVKPIKLKIRYTLTVKPDEVPDSEMVRVWMPYPRSNEKQKNIKLISTSQPDYIISPDEYAHKSIYMEKKAKASEPTVFQYELSYTAHNQWFSFTPEQIKPYNKESDLYIKYTSERDSHVIFTDDIKRITDSIIGNIENPYLKTKRIFDYIFETYPWASAREYSTIRNIPQYVIDNKHGDCGQVALLFITMARYAGVPAKWQSGWMFHPGNMTLHDWAEVYYEGIGWVPFDQSFGKIYLSDDPDTQYFFTKGLDAYHFIVNDDYSSDLYPAKIYPRSETVDFQRGEVEWKGENLYFGRWRYRMEVEFE